MAIVKLQSFALALLAVALIGSLESPHAQTAAGLQLVADHNYPAEATSSFSITLAASSPAGLDVVLGGIVIHTPASCTTAAAPTITSAGATLAAHWVLNLTGPSCSWTIHVHADNATTTLATLYLSGTTIDAAAASNAAIHWLQVIAWGAMLVWAIFRCDIVGPRYLVLVAFSEIALLDALLEDQLVGAWPAFVNVLLVSLGWLLLLIVNKFGFGKDREKS